MEQDQQLPPNSGQPPQDNENQLSQKPNPKKKGRVRSKGNSSPRPILINGSPKNSEEKKSLSESESESSLNGKGNNSLPVPKLTDSVDRKAEAIRRLKLKPGVLEKAPPLHNLLKETIKGGLKTAITAMRFAADDEVIADFLSKYDSIPVGDRAYLPWEAIGISAGVDLKHLLGSVQLAVVNYCGNKSKMIAVTNHPAIVKARVGFGKELVGAERDRTALDMMVGALPSPKGPTFIGKAIFGSGNKGQDDDDDGPKQVTATPVFDADSDLDQLFPPCNAMQERLVPIRQKMLTEGK
jgi:hypothetical protein